MQTTQLLEKFLVSISQFKTKFEGLFSYGLQREALTSIKLGTYMLLVGAKSYRRKLMRNMNLLEAKELLHEFIGYISHNSTNSARF